MSYREKILAKYVQLQTENALLMQDIKQFDETQLLYQPNENNWCIIQVLNHLKNTEVGTLRYIQKKVKYGGLKKVNLSSGLRAFLMRLVNNSSIRFKMPTVLSQPSTDGSLESIQNEWSELRSEWKGFIEQLPNRVPE